MIVGVVVVGGCVPVAVISSMIVIVIMIMVVCVGVTMIVAVAVVVVVGMAVIVGMVVSMAMVVPLGGLAFGDRRMAVIVIVTVVVTMVVAVTVVMTVIVVVRVTGMQFGMEQRIQLRDRHVVGCGQRAESESRRVRGLLDRSGRNAVAQQGHTFARIAQKDAAGQEHELRHAWIPGGSDAEPARGAGPARARVARWTPPV